MVADSQGNDLDAVGVPITGLSAYAPVEAENVIAKPALGADPLVLPAGFKKLGLYTADGGPEPGQDVDDPTEFFQAGYAIAGNGTRTLAVTYAELNDAVLELIEGIAPDENGVIEVSSTLPSNRFILLDVVRFRNGKERRREGVAQIKTVEPAQSTRGTPEGNKVTYTWREDDLFNGAPFWQFYGTPGAGVAATGVTAGTPGSFTPSSATVPATLTDLQALGALGQTAAWSTGQYVNLGDASKAYWNGTAWASGTAA